MFSRCAVYDTGASRVVLSTSASKALYFDQNLATGLVKVNLALVQGTPRHQTPHPDQYSVKCAQSASKSTCYMFCTDHNARTWCTQLGKKAHSLEADELSDLPVSKYVSFGLSEASFCGVEHAWKPQALMREMHLLSSRLFWV